MTVSPGSGVLIFDTPLPWVHWEVELALAFVLILYDGKNAR